ncbi:TauD/TfdA dioxygenase family protein [Paenirhodobacter hankyongi]|uniref:TauD/TfdA family dioxygenase n=1 Tax=Paenirhodobacter hankyongi TaxID=2294033 RepID=A0A421BJD2_9RHOB|nr:TauD/TfdA family dioxygenase [Sinirhodobacter hankyongi]RLL61884.1 TauD/TfdA family dioxygenase [Sinirhodobacter hankyongi]
MTQQQTNPSGPPVLEVLPLTPIIGAEIRGLRLSADLPAPAIAALRTLIARHKVVFLRQQEHLDDAAQTAFARQLGDLVRHPPQHDAQTSPALFEEVSAHDGRAGQWHSTATFLPAYPKYTVLRGVVIPPTGGDTIWANTTAAYQSLPPALKRLAESLRAVHSNADDDATRLPSASGAENTDCAGHLGGTTFQTEHPVVRLHPETGEQSLLLGSFVRRIPGLSRADTRHIHGLFQGFITAPENTVRWRWQAGDVVICDNRATQHVDVDDYGEALRILRRVTVDGDIPVGVDGRKSIAIAGPDPDRSSLAPPDHPDDGATGCEVHRTIARTAGCGVFDVPFVTDGRVAQFSGSVP